MLVLVEPGTPLGFQVVAAARSQVLTTEARKRAKLLRQAPAAQAAAAGGAAGDAVLALDHNLTSKLQRSGAHVVAPCPHDGACPLAGQCPGCASARAKPAAELCRAALACLPQARIAHSCPAPA